MATPPRAVITRTMAIMDMPIPLFPRMKSGRTLLNLRPLSHSPSDFSGALLGSRMKVFAMIQNATSQERVRTRLRLSWKAMAGPYPIFSSRRAEVTIRSRLTTNTPWRPMTAHFSLLPLEWLPWRIVTRVKARRTRLCHPTQFQLRLSS